VLQPAIELAENGYPMHADLREHLLENLKKYTELYPTTGRIYCPAGASPRSASSSVTRTGPTH